MSLLLAAAVVWTLVDSWPFRWLAWLWLVVVSLPLLVMVIAVWSLIMACKGTAATLNCLRDAVVPPKSIAEKS